MLMCSPFVTQELPPPNSKHWESRMRIAGLRNGLRTRPSDIPQSAIRIPQSPSAFGKDGAVFLERRLSRLGQFRELLGIVFRGEWASEPHLEELAGWTHEFRDE